MRTMRTALVVVAVVVAGGCGVPLDDGPRRIDAADVPYELLSGDPPTEVPSTAAPSPTSVDITVYLVAHDRLAPARRAVTAPAGVADRLRALQSGPTEAEAAAGLRSAVDPGPGELTVEGAAGPVVTVGLPASFADVIGPDHVLAIAQVVCTVTEVPGAELVSFTLAGQHVDVPRGDGTLTGAPVARADYAALLG